MTGTDVRGVRGGRLKVGLVTPRYPPALGGVELYTYRLATGLVERGATVQVITTDPTGELPPVEHSEGVRVRRFPTLGHDDVYFLSPALGQWLLRRAPQFSLLHAQNYHAPLALQTAFACRRRSVPFVVTPHFHGTGHSRFRSFLHVPYRPLGRWMLQQADQVICDSEAERRRLETGFGTDFGASVAFLGVDQAEIAATPPMPRRLDRRLILAVGRLEPYKQTARIVEAVAGLPENVDCVIVGDGPERPAVENMIHTLGVERRVTLAGRVEKDELLSWYRTADAFVALSRHEAFGLTLLEAAAGGAVIVASRIEAHAEVSAHLPPSRVTLVDVDCTARELAAAIAGVTASPRSPGPLEARLPGWGDMVDRILDLYTGVVRRRGTDVSVLDTPERVEAEVGAR